MSRGKINKDLIYFLHVEGGKNLSEIAKQLGCTREYARQVLLKDYGLASLTRKRSKQVTGSRRLMRAIAIAANLERRAHMHGTVTRYQHGGCRCPECTQAKTEYARMRKDKRGEASPYVCEICGDAVWQNNFGHVWRHYNRRDHKPVPVRRRPLTKDQQEAITRRVSSRRAN